MGVNSKMTALADEIRELSGTTTTKSIDVMTSDVSAANTEIAEQAELLEQIATALEGKASGSGGVALPTLDNPASVSDILSGKEAIDSAGNVLIGTIPSKTATTYTPTTSDQTIASGTYLTGIQTIKGDANLVASNIISGKSIFGVVGTATTGSGDGSGDTSVEDGLIEGTLTNYTNDKVTNIRRNVFQYCTKLTSVNFPACQTIGSYAFGYCSKLTSVNFSQCISIYECAFMSCSSLTSVNFPVCINIGNSAFSACTSLTSINFPACEIIGSSVFYNCRQLTSVSFPACRTIAGYAFKSCSSLTSVSFPVCINIGVSAFDRCTNLKSITLLASSVCSLASSTAFTSTGIKSTAGSIFVPASLVDAYKAATNWSYFSNRIFGI